MSLKDEEAAAVMSSAAGRIETTLRNAVAKITADIRGGLSPRRAIDRALSTFHGEYYDILAEGLGKMLAESISTAAVKKWRIGEVTLSHHLYRSARVTSLQAAEVIRKHVRYQQSVRDLARTIFAGYGQRAPNGEIIKPAVKLPKYMDAGLEDEVQAFLARARAASLRSPALRAGYLRALDTMLEGAGDAAMRRALQSAVFERHRYFANRIAQTELHRAHADERARGLLAMESLDVVQIVLSKTHPEPDICDLYARQDRFGLGPGCYPKAQAPKPPFHPFCRCLIRPRLDLTAQGAQDRPGAGAAYLRNLSPKSAARVAGSRAKRDAILDGQQPERVFNAGRPAAYWIRDFASAVTEGTKAAVKSAQVGAKKAATAAKKSIRAVVSALDNDKKYWAIRDWVNTSRTKLAKWRASHGMTASEKMHKVTWEGIDFLAADELTGAVTQSIQNMMTLKKLPVRFKKHTKRVLFSGQRNNRDPYWEKEYNKPGFTSLATGGDGQVVVYNWNSLDVSSTVHEMGHNFAKGRYGRTDPPSSSDFYAATIVEPPPTEYAKAAIAEDFAESCKLFFTAPATLKDIAPRRYKIIARMMKDENYSG